MFYKNNVLKHFAKFTEKHLCEGHFFNKVAGLRLLKKRLWHQCFPVNFAEFLRTSADNCHCNNERDPMRIGINTSLSKNISVRHQTNRVQTGVAVQHKQQTFEINVVII